MGSHAIPPRPKPQVRSLDSIEDRRGISESLPPHLSGLVDDGASQMPSDSILWTPIADIPAHFPILPWLKVMHELVLHPERNSTSILRADVLDSLLHNDQNDEHDDITDPVKKSMSQQWYCTAQVRRRLLPRQPHIDRPLLQDCTFYRRSRRCVPKGFPPEGSVIYTPLLDDRGSIINGRPLASHFPSSPDQIPFYHPRVRAIAFRYIPTIPSGDDEFGSTQASLANNECLTPTVFGELRIEVVHYSSPDGLSAEAHKSAASSQSSTRLRRTAQRLLQTAHQHSWGTWHGYVSRVTHDVLVPKELYQDVYLGLKQRHAQRLVSEWKESTDPSKHVFEELGIAAWLMCLWKNMYEESKRPRQARLPAGQNDQDYKSCLWTTWGAPRGGFVDVGCGNGMLVHVLQAEGYEGFGFDLRARKSWPHWVGADLRVLSLDAPALILTTLSNSKFSSLTSHGELLRLFPVGSFLIGNHADELSPWLPLLASATPGSAFVNIACCPWELLNRKFTRTKYNITESSVRELLGMEGSYAPVRNGDPPPPTSESVTEADLLSSTISAIARGPSDPQMSTVDSQSRNVAYLNYLADLQLQAGWHIEKEALRIPSTKNWALVGRRRVWEVSALNLKEKNFDVQTEKMDAMDAFPLRGSQYWADEQRHRAEERVCALAAQAAPNWIAREPEGNSRHC